jgi:hypothetical protein
MAGKYVITGRIRDKDNTPVEGYNVEAFDSDPAPFGLDDDFLGSTKTDKDGDFRISFDELDFKKRLEWLEGNPEVYLKIKDEDDWVVIRTMAKENKTQNMEFQIKLGKSPGNRSEPDLYLDSIIRMIAGLRGAGDSADLSKSDVRVIFELLLRVLKSWTINRDEVLQLSGYDGIQVPKYPREQKHDHVTRWDKPLLKD